MTNIFQTTNKGMTNEAIETAKKTDNEIKNKGFWEKFKQKKKEPKENKLKMTKQEYEKAQEKLKKELSELTLKNLETLKQNLKTTTGTPHPQINTINDQLTTNINHIFDQYIGINKETLAIKPFLPQTTLQKILTFTEYKQNFKEPLLILIRANNNVEIMEGVRPGTFITLAKESTVNNEEKENKKEYLELAPSKLLKLYYGGRYFSCWIASELDSIPYPHAIKHDSHLLYLLVKRFALSWKEFKEGPASKFNFKVVFWIVAGIIILLYLAFQLGWIDKLLASNTPQVITQVAVNTTSGTIQ